MAKAGKKDKSSNELLRRLHKKMDKMAVLIERSRIAEYVELNQKPWKIVLFNFLGGIGRGVGIAIGLTLISAVVIIILTQILSHLITLPLVGEWIANLVSLVNQYLGESQRLKLQ